jgi:hypothetical protein
MRRALLTRRSLCAWLGGSGLLLAAGCSGERRTFAGTQRESVPTNVSGSSDTSGISAGAALQPPGGGAGSGGTPTPTTTPTATPAPSK